MLLLHQAGSVKIGEVVRYTVTYRPSADRILPSPELLYLRIKNTSAIALRAAFVHGPYTLSVAAYPSTFKPFEKFENPRRYGVPEFEPMLKAGAVWNCHLVVPDNIRQTAGEGVSQHGCFGAGPGHDEDTATWVIEVTSQILFSTSAAVHYEILLARDEKSLNLGSVVSVIGGQSQAPQPGRVSDFQQSAGAKEDHPAQLKGVFSKAIHVKVEDTAALWNTPQLPGWDDMGWLRARSSHAADAPVEPTMSSGKPEERRERTRWKPKKVHLVVLTHGLHSNLGSDMLFLKESIDAAVKQAKADAKARKARERAARRQTAPSDSDGLPSEGSGQTNGFFPATAKENCGDGGNDQQDDDSDDDEEVIVRGFSGNATRTERGIKYLGKRLARYILSMTYPDQPCLPTAKAASEAIAHTLKTTSQKKAIEEAHKHSSAHHVTTPGGDRLYKFTKISFIAHSLGGLVQTYAIAYIQKHSPRFFELIEPINFIALASPFLGLNHENPLYVKFALDFGLVGRTGQDLGLTWRAPTIARNGWSALVSNLGEHAHKRVHGDPQPESKPLLRILPTGPAHKALKKFRNRTVYSNVVNDGIVPLRTSCLLFLDWQGLGRVEKARREAGLVETVVGFGWAELTGATVTTPRLAPWSPDESEDKEEANDTGKSTPTKPGDSHVVPQPSRNATLEDDRQSLRSMTVPYQEQAPSGLQNLQTASTSNSNPFSGLFSFFRSEASKPTPSASPKVTKIYQRGQTLKVDRDSVSDSPVFSTSKVTAGNEQTGDVEPMSAPPRTTIFESAGDLLNPKLPSVEFLIDPSKRPRTIFHDRVYHPSDIPPPPLKGRSSNPLALRIRSAATNSTQKSAKSEPVPSPARPSPSITLRDSSVSEPTNPPSSKPKQSADDSTVHTSLSASTGTLNTESNLPPNAPNSPPTSSEAPATPPLPNHPPTPPPPNAAPGRALTSTAAEETDDAQEQVVDSSQMRVEEKIARAYHRGLSWRKVLVKLEPDAHNNIVVRRTFANAFGWPVVQHLVEAHFSDAAMARRRDEDEPGVDRAAAKGVGGNHDGGVGEEAGRGEGKKGKGDENAASGERRETDGGEDADTVPDLPRGPKIHGQPGVAGENNNALGVTFASSSSSPTTPARPPLDRLDSVTWSDRDWADSADESDDGGVGRKTAAAAASVTAGAGGGGGGLGGVGIGLGLGEKSGASSSSAWSWTEKIVGKSAAKTRPRSPDGGGGSGQDGDGSK
ncbi:hypothetical protein VTK26DRAFT_3888 [Humicola hyalothermophila]